MYQGIPVRMANVVGERYTQSAWWGDGCPDGYGAKRQHFQQVDWPIYGIDESFRPTACDKCGTRYAGEEIWGGAGTHRIYDTPSGKLEPGCLFWADWFENDGRCHYGWTNCGGRHLMAVCPNGHQWDIDARASNCGLPDDTEHRCWVRHGEPPNVTVDKDGRTCVAGAGSIVAGDYHGFLHGGRFTDG
jgi:hypothetical protein